MASQSTDPTAGPERIAFEVEGLKQTEPERVEVRGRWLGVRGRRFVRPTLTVVVDGVQRRALADLDDKPWAAEPGAPWRAVFPLDVELAKATHVELSVAPDITVKLVDPNRPRPPRRRRPSPELLRAPRVRTDAGAPAPNLTEHARELERLNSRLISAAQDLERERREAAKAAEEGQRLRERLQTTTEELEREQARRAEADEELEDQRSEALRLRAQLGQIQAELDLVRAAQSEIAAAAADRNEMSLALDRARAEAKQLRSQLAEARERLARASGRPSGDDAAAQGGSRSEARLYPTRDGSPEPAVQTSARGAGPAEQSARSRSDRREERPASRGQAAAPTRAERPGPARAERPGPARADRSGPARADRPGPARADRPGPARAERPGAPRSERGLPPRPERPLNPSLRHRTYWIGRILVVLIMAAVVAAIVLVIRSTGAL